MHILKKYSILGTTLLVTCLALTSCSAVSNEIGTKPTDQSSCLNFLNGSGVFSVGYTGLERTTINSDKGKPSITNFVYTVDATKQVAFYNTGEIGSTSIFFKDGSVINKADPEEVVNLKPLLKQLKIIEPKWFQIEGQPLTSTVENDPAIANYLKLIKENKKISKDKDSTEYKYWDESSYKSLTVYCSEGRPMRVVTKYGQIENNKSRELIRTDYTIKYNNPTITIPQKDVVNYTKMLGTIEGRIFIGKPITKIAFGFVMDFINLIKPGKRLSDQEFVNYQDYIANTVNNEPEMNAIVLTRKGNNLEGLIPLDGLDYFYCIKLERDSGAGTLIDNKCQGV